jgi:hypothetical protein
MSFEKNLFNLVPEVPGIVNHSSGNFGSYKTPDGTFTMVHHLPTNMVTIEYSKKGELSNEQTIQINLKLHTDECNEFIRIFKQKNGLDRMIGGKKSSKKVTKKSSKKVTKKTSKKVNKKNSKKTSKK